MSRRQLWRAATKLRQLRDGELDRRQRARGQDRAGDDDAGGGLLADHQIGADAEHGRLQDHAQDAGDSAASRPPMSADALLGGEVAAVVRPATASPDAGRHAHRLDHLGVAAAGFGQRHCGRRQGRRPPWPARGVRNSVTMVMATRIRPPTVGGDADQGMEAKQMPR